MDGEIGSQCGKKSKHKNQQIHKIKYKVHSKIKMTFLQSVLSKSLAPAIPAL
jgi:hypothetical protein